MDGRRENLEALRRIANGYDALGRNDYRRRQEAKRIMISGQYLIGSSIRRFEILTVDPRCNRPASNENPPIPLVPIPIGIIK